MVNVNNGENIYKHQSCSRNSNTSHHDGLEEQAAKTIDEN